MAEIRPMTMVDMAKQIGTAIAKAQRPPMGQIKFTGPPTENRTSTNLPVNDKTIGNVASARKFVQGSTGTIIDVTI